jgi:hypothetical protein
MDLNHTTAKNAAFVLRIVPWPRSREATRGAKTTGCRDPERLHLTHKFYSVLKTQVHSSTTFLSHCKKSYIKHSLARNIPGQGEFGK